MFNDINFLKQSQTTGSPRAKPPAPKGQSHSVEFSKPQAKPEPAHSQPSRWAGLVKRLGGFFSKKSKASVTPPPAAVAAQASPTRAVSPKPTTFEPQVIVKKEAVPDRLLPASVSLATKNERVKNGNGKPSVSAPAAASSISPAPQLPPSITSQIKAPATKASATATTRPFLGDLAGVNLIPSAERADLSRRSWLMIAASGAAAVVMVIIVYVGMIFYRSQQTAISEALQNRVTELQARLEQSRQQTEKALAFQLRLQAVDGLLSSRLNWLPLFAFLERTVVPSVSYSSLAADSGGKVTLAGLAASFTDVAKQMRALADANEVSAVEVSGLKLNPGGGEIKPSVTFTFTLTLVPEVFKPQVVVKQ
ncbi:MAG: PilN domain-containing protein [Candidatus Kerfeldbacteria bacterium]|nr:PilN domain-containing protein [Candidatus Kerfeldbacteria bacterium]